jgi:ankyrin repeat protein
MINSHSTLKYPLALTTISLLVTCNNGFASHSESHNSQPQINQAAPTTGASVDTALENYTAEDEALFGSPLAYLIAIDEVTHVNTLLKAGVAEVNQLNFLDETPLEQAIQNDSIAMVTLLIQHGAKVNYLAEPVSCNAILANANGGNIRFYDMPLDLARQKGNLDIITLLEKAGAKSTTECFEAENSTL